MATKIEKLEKDRAAIAARLAQLEAELEGLQVEKRQLEQQIAARVAKDATGEQAYTDAEHKRNYEAALALDVRIDRLGKSVDALRLNLPALDEQVHGARVEAVIGRFDPVNGEIRKTCGELARALAKVREIAGRLQGFYDQHGELAAEFRELNAGRPETLPEVCLAYPPESSFAYWLNHSKDAFDEQDTVFLAMTAESETRRIEAERREQERQAEATRKGLEEDEAFRREQERKIVNTGQGIPSRWARP